MHRKWTWFVISISLFSVLHIVAMADDDAVSLSYDFATPRQIAYDIRVLSRQKGSFRGDLTPVQDRRYQLTIKCLGENRLICEISGCSDEYGEDVDKDMAFSLGCTVGNDGNVTDAHEIEYKLGQKAMDAKREEQIRYLLRSYLIRALNEVTIRLPKEKRSPGQSWLDSERSWPFTVTKDSDVVFPFLTLETLPSLDNNSTVEINASILDFGGRIKNFPDLLDYRRTTTGRYTYDSNLNLITKAVIIAEQEGNNSGRNGELETTFGVVRFEANLAAPPEALPDEPEPK